MEILRQRESVSVTGLVYCILFSLEVRGYSRYHLRNCTTWLHDISTGVVKFVLMIHVVIRFLIISVDRKTCMLSTYHIKGRSTRQIIMAISILPQVKYCILSQFFLSVFENA